MAMGISAPAPVGRPSKGPRDAILARPHASLAKQIRQLAQKARLTNGEYMVKLAAEHIDMPEFLPCPSVRNVRALEAEPVLEDGRDAIKCRPPVAFGHILKRLAKKADLNYGEYLVMLAAHALGHTEHAPQADSRIDREKPLANQGTTLSRSSGASASTRIGTARLPRNTRVDPVKFGYVIDRPYKTRFEKLAAHAGASGAVFLEALLNHLETELTDRGVPSWWPAPEPKDGELDLFD